jgi:hypothetical protein
MPLIAGLNSGGRCITLDETCLDGGARWNGCRMLSGTSCGLGIDAAVGTNLVGTRSVLGVALVLSGVIVMTTAT